MSEHKTGKSSWTPEQKKLYRERREKGLRGQTGYVNVNLVVKDEKGKDQQVPLGYRRGPGRSARSLMPTRMLRRAGQRRAARTNARGD